MPQQNSFPGTMKVGFPGQRVGIVGFQSRTYVNDLGTARHTIEATITAATNGATYTIVVNGNTVSWTAPAAGTTLAMARDGLVAAGRAISALEGAAILNPSAADKLRVLSYKPGTAITVTEADTKITLATITANATPENIPFGLALVKRTGTGTTELSATLPSETGQTLLGILERTESIVDPLGVVASDRAPAGSRLSVGMRGTWLVQVEVAVEAEDPVFFRHTAGAGQQVGAWRNDADTDTADAVLNSK